MRKKWKSAKSHTAVTQQDDNDDNNDDPPPMKEGRNMVKGQPN